MSISVPHRIPFALLLGLSGLASPGCKSVADEPAAAILDAGTPSGGTGGVDTRPHQGDAGSAGGTAAAGGSGGDPSNGGTSTPPNGGTGGGPQGGTATGGAAPTGGTEGTGGQAPPPPPPPPPPAGANEPCDPTARTPCQAGLVCYGNDSGVCLPSCDANFPSDCGPGGACLMVGDACPNAGACPGACYPSDGCEPGNEAAVCGDPASCLPYGGGSFCMFGGTATLGQTCDGSTACQPGLACDAGRCAEPCAVAADGGTSCATGYCVDRNTEIGSTYNVCHVDCDWEAQAGCSGGEACIPVDVVRTEHQGFEGNVIQESVLYGCIVADVGAATDGQACQPSDATWWGTCTPINSCEDDGNGGNVCYRLCVGACGDGARLCTLAGEGPLGYCYGECDVIGGLKVDGTDCGAGRVCAASGFGESGFCVDAADAPGTLGAPCAVNPRTNVHDCGAGLFCPTNDAHPVCRSLCSHSVCCPDANGQCEQAAGRGSNCPIGGVPAGFDPAFESDRLGFCP